jgi:hypothetical protein
MSNAPYTPPPAAPPASTQVLDYENVPPTGVRKVLDAMEERNVQRLRWGAVIGGLFIAVATQILLGMLGVAVGLTAVDPRSPNPFAGLGTGAGIWMALSSLLALFLGGFAAAKLNGSIRRSDGMVSGLLTWATSLVLTLWLVGVGAGMAVNASAQAAQNPDVTRRVPPAAQVQQPERAMRDLGQAARQNVDDAARGAWYGFGGAVLSLLTALLGGAVGSAGAARRRHGHGRRDFRDFLGEGRADVRAEVRSDYDDRVQRIRDHEAAIERERELLRREEMRRDEIRRAG